MTYEELTGNTTDILREWIKGSPLSTAPYSTLETYFKVHERPDFADDVFIEMKRRERREVLNWSSARFWWNLVLDGIVGFGRHPERAFVWSAIPVVIGAFLFRRSKMELRKPECTNMYYHPFWYSLDLLTPFIDLQSASEWMPKQKWLYVYSRFHRILGWLLIPIGLAAITGIVGK
jgi:hypothetical protein